MAAQEDPALLFLIFQHLKVNGFTKAARVLEKHLVPQVETPPAESLHEIYSGWMKLCSLAKHAKQEADDSLNSKRVKVEFIPSEEEAADSKLCGVSGEDELKAELLHDCESDIVESSHPEENPESQFEPQHEATTSVPVKELDGESCDSSVTEVEEEKTKEELEASIEESAEVSNEEKVSSDTQETVKSSQPECDLALHGESTEGPQEDAEASKGLITNSSTSEVPGEAPASERTDSDLTKTADVLDEEKDEEKSTLEPTDLIIIDLTEETNDHLVERQAPPPADFATEKPIDEEEQEEEEQVEQDEENDNKSESVGGADVLSELYPDAAAEKPTEAQAQKQTEAADLLTPHSDVPEEPDVSINIQADAEAAPQESSQSVPEESSESCADSKTPKKKKKKKNKRNMETPGTDTLVTETPSTNASDPGDTPLTSKSSKKKRRHQRREKDDQKEEAAEEEEEEEEFIPAAASEKKKAKKRKRDKEAAGTTFETKTISKHVGEDLGEENTPAETTGKPKKKKRKKEKEGPSEDAPAEGDDETEKTDSLDGKKKKHLCRKLSLRRRPRFYGKREKMNEMMNSIHRRQKLAGKKKLKEETLDEKSQMNPVKRAQADDETEIKAPKRRRKKKKMIIMEQEESSLKENEPPGKQKKSLQTRDKNGVGEEFLEEDLSLLSNEGKKKKKKKKVKDENVEESTGAVDVSQPPLYNKKKKRSLMAGLEDADLDTGLDADSHTPTKKKKSSS